MEARDFERDLSAWLDGELPAEHAARMQAAVDASPELAQRVAMERVFDVRVKRALASDAVDVDAVRRMAARPRAGKAPAGRLLGLPRGALKIAASLVLVVTGAMWWFCIPPFECSYLQALEAASHDPAAVPGPAADALAKRYGMPSEIDGAVAAGPVAATNVHFWTWHAEGVRLDYVRADGSAFQVVVCESPGLQPSIRRRVERDGLGWWMADISGHRVVAFVRPGGDDDDVCAVTGPLGDESVYDAAKALRASFR